MVVRAVVSLATALLVMLALAACGGSSMRTRQPAINVVVNGAGTGTATTPAATGTQATQTSTVSRSPALNQLKAVMQRQAAALGATHVGIAVEDLTTGQMLDGQNVNAANPPASLEKLYTSAAMLWLLGPAARLHTELLGTGYLFAGTWHGNLYLRGDGDPTFGDGNWNKLYEQGDGPTAADLVADLKALHITRVTGRLYADASRFDTAEGGPLTDNGADPGDYGGRMSALVYDHGFIVGKLGPAATAVHEVALTARMSGISVQAAPKPATTPAGAKDLATLSSPTLSTMLGLMDGPSDDLFADLFAKQLGYHFAGQGTLDAGAEQITQAIRSHYGISPTIHDGSGLDKSDRSTPADFLTLLAKMNGSSYGNIVRRALPVVGKSGTVAGIGLKTAAAGRCEAKTGTLNYVTNLAGYCTARDGHTLAFAFMVDGPDNDDAIYAFTPMIAAVARY